jgi:glycerol-3-phosphate dehydrogenase (NAD(P)+)
VEKRSGIRITVLGGGSWGTALTVLLASKGHSVALWEFVPERAEAMRTCRENRLMLPGIGIPDEVLITSDIAEACRGSEHLLLVVPSHALRQTAASLVEHKIGPLPVTIATKGIEETTLKRMSEVAAEVLGRRADGICVLVGPSHAEEVSRGVPTTVVASSADRGLAEAAQEIFMTPTFRVYTNADMIGVEVGVSLKNVVAIAAGMCDGLGFGDNTKGALLTRGLAEITRLGVKMGARQETFSGLAGIGDLITTCISRHSRNRHVGEQMARGKTLDEVLAGMVMVAEGVRTTKSAVALAAKHDVEMPIAGEVHEILFRGKSARQAMKDLMLRGRKPEIWW